MSGHIGLGLKARRNLAALAMAIVCAGCGAFEPGIHEVACGDLVLRERGTDAPPRVALDAATRTALDELNKLNPKVVGLTLSNACLAPGLVEVRGVTGDRSYAATNPEDSWVLEFLGPAQNGFQTVRALVVVNSDDGTVSSAGIEQH